MNKLTIGRGPENDIVVPHHSVSRRHAELADLGGGRYRLTDLRSTNGTFHYDGDALVRVETPVEVGHETRIAVGDHEATVRQFLADGETLLQAREASTAPQARTENLSGREVPPPASAARASASPAIAFPSRRVVVIAGSVVAALVVFTLLAVTLWPSPRTVFVARCLEGAIREGGPVEQAGKAKDTCVCAGDVLASKLTEDEFRELNRQMASLQTSTDPKAQFGKRIITGTLVNQNVSKSVLQAAKVCAL